MRVRLAEYDAAWRDLFAQEAARIWQVLGCTATISESASLVGGSTALLKGPDTDVNLHVFTLGCPEVERMIRFRDHLRANSSDRRRYEALKHELASRDWESVQNYADAKTTLIEEMLASALAPQRKVTALRFRFFNPDGSTSELPVILSHCNGKHRPLDRSKTWR